MPGRIAYFLVLLFLAVLGFSVRLDLWVSVIVAAVAMSAVSLFEMRRARPRAPRAALGPRVRLLAARMLAFRGRVR